MLLAVLGNRRTQDIVQLKGELFTFAHAIVLRLVNLTSHVGVETWSPLLQSLVSKMRQEAVSNDKLPLPSEIASVLVFWTGERVHSYRRRPL